MVVIQDKRPSLLNRTCQIMFVGTTCLGAFCFYRHKVTLNLLRNRVASLSKPSQGMQVADLDHGILLTNVSKADLLQGRLQGFLLEEGELLFDQKTRLIPSKDSMFEFPETVDLYAKYNSNGFFRRSSYLVRDIGHPEQVARVTEDMSWSKLQENLIGCFLACCILGPLGFM